MNVHLLLLSAIFSISDELVFALSDKIKILFSWNTNSYLGKVPDNNLCCFTDSPNALASHHLLEAVIEAD